MKFLLTFFYTIKCCVEKILHCTRTSRTYAIVGMLGGQGNKRDLKHKSDLFVPPYSKR